MPWICPKTRHGDPFKQVRGAAIRVWVPDLIAGRILSIENRLQKKTATAETTEFKRFTLNLATQEGIKSIPLETIARFRLADEETMVSHLEETMEKQW